MELRTPPAGGDEFAHRGNLNLVRMTNQARLPTVCPSLPFQDDPTCQAIPPTKCLPHHIVEGIYARLLSPDDVGLALRFGFDAVDIAARQAVENIMDSQGFDFSTTRNLNELVRDVARHGQSHLVAADFPFLGANAMSLQPMPAGQPASQTWGSVPSLVE